jgi:hypothetical protein
MSEVGRASGHAAGELAKMVTEGWVPRVVKGIEDAIAKSFAEDRLIIGPVTTQHEIKRRFNFCIEGFKIMRRDLGWAVPRIVDALPGYLRAKLDGTGWNPPPEERQSWVKDGAERAAVIDGPDMAPEVPDVAGVEVEGIG